YTTLFRSDHPVDAADMPPVLVDEGHARIPRTVGAARPLQAPEPRLLGELEEVKDEREPGQRRDGGSVRGAQRGTERSAKGGIRRVPLAQRWVLAPRRRSATLDLARGRGQSNLLGSGSPPSTRPGGRPRGGHSSGSAAFSSSVRQRRPTEARNRSGRAVTGLRDEIVMALAFRRTVFRSILRHPGVDEIRPAM